MLTDFLMAIATFFLNPVFYVALFAATMLGYFRVKKERRIFRTRIVYGGTEFKRLLKDGWLYALILSVIVAAAGLAVPMEWLIALSIVSIVIMLTGFYHLASFVYLAGAAALIVWLFEANNWNVNLGFAEMTGRGLTDGWLVSVALIAGLLLFIESRMVEKSAADSASPRLHKSARGLRAAAYISRRLWLIPAVLVVPGEMISEYAPYWPQLPIGESAFSLILFPLVFGFQGRSKRTLPVYLYPKIAKSIAWSAVLTIVLALFGFLWQPMAIIALAAGALFRLGISIYYAQKERSGNYTVTPQAQGVMIIDVLPGSPAEKMGLVRGEVIRKVNGTTVTNETELYEAIQLNAAHCRLEVIDHNLEMRLRQHVVFRHDHHRLGLLIVE
ncbi:PDZ domain-containing protein [Planococcus alpniumensis]|uniref:PDZ domain-containing protein n=1 Tax=Planococcus alpniumensis TaxID=2708345 RepID=UPI0032C4B0EB